MPTTGSTLTILGYYLYCSVTEGGLALPKITATGIVGAYGGLVGLSTVLGGWIADRLLGMEVPALLVVGIMAVFAISELLLSPTGCRSRQSLRQRHFGRR